MKRPDSQSLNTAPTVSTETMAHHRHLETFASALLARATPEFYALYDDNALRGIASDAFNFWDEPSASPARVRIFNPERAVNGWWSSHTILEVALTDRPFILDSIRELLSRRGVRVHHVLHPILDMQRASSGHIHRIETLHGAAEDKIASALRKTSPIHREAFLHWQIERIADPAQREQLASEINACLADVILATDDFKAMNARVRDVSAALNDAPPPAIGEIQESSDWTAEVREIQKFLQWLRDGAFVFLGYRAYEFVPVDGRRVIRVEPGSGLGILRKEDRSTYSRPVPLDQLPTDLRARIEGGPLLLVAKTNTESAVHRRVAMNYIGIKKMDAKGHYVGEFRFVGLFTSKARREEAAQIPMLRTKLQRILDVEQVVAGTHDYKEITALFNSFPKELLFESNLAELHQDIRAVMRVMGHDEAHLHIRPHPMRRGIVAIIAMPRWRYSEDIRARIQQLLEKHCGGTVLEFHLVLDEHEQTRLHFTLSADASVLTPRVRELLQNAVMAAAKSWQERLLDKLVETHSAAARPLHGRYAESFPPDYTAVVNAAEAAADITMLERLRVEGRPQVSMLNGSRHGLRFTIIKFYFNGSSWLLSEILPILNNFGLRVMEEVPVALKGAGLEQTHIQQFFVQSSRGEPLDLPTVEPLLSPALLGVAAGEQDDGGLNALVISAGLSIREVDLLRAYRNFAFQIHIAPTRFAAEQAFIQNPTQARELFEFFRAKFDLDESKFGPPDWRVSSRLPELKKHFLENLRRVESIAHDRTFKSFLNLIEATVRTNFYQGRGHPISLKFDCMRLEQLPSPRPLFEIYVHSARLEGCHLRGGKVSRGGLRYSDRHDDFRTEILGLMKTQKVKNAPIVPTGAKGGFVIRSRGGLSSLVPPGIRAQTPPEMLKEHYSHFIRALLDVTDNIVEGKLVPPPRCVRYDDNDPYLVVAADKGTAHLSDTANAISAEYDFWLGDAFASGGSQGYDHKALGITARGGWECVKRHFREMGRDTQTQEFTTIGIGSPDGDVFGNGVLRSRKMKLLAAFSHKEIFLDPDPDPEISFNERQRLFRAVKSWQDYDAKLISKGGGVFKRASKEIPLSPEVRAMLGVKEESLDGESLIRTILKMKADLLWNGGIGTYVKATSEKHADAQDPANDGLRINPTDLHVAVVGEGGNLGFTQLARIEFAMRGGRINTDAIDNSGGVDTSDHEVNLKILFQPLMKQGNLSFDERNRLLRELTDDVAAAVLRDNFTQSLAISLDQRRSREHLDEYVGLMRSLEESGLLARELERLPELEELQMRQDKFAGLTRPELAVLLAYSKIWLCNELLAPASAAFLEDPALERFLLNYFPHAAVERFPEAPRQHSLRRDIIATQLTNEITDAMGCAFVHEAVQTGASPLRIVQCWLEAWQNPKLQGRERWLALLEKDAGGKIQADYAEFLKLQDELRVDSGARLVAR